MRKFSFALLCFILLPSLVWSQAASKLSPRVRPFVRGDAPKIVLTHVRVTDGTGAAARADQTLLIEDGKIAATGDAASTKIPYDAKTIDLTDRTVIPGLVGMHDPHALSLARKIASALSGTRVKLPRLCLAGGVTSIRTGPRFTSLGRRQFRLLRPCLREGPMPESMRTTRPAQELHTVTIGRFHQFHSAL